MKKSINISLNYLIILLLIPSILITLIVIAKFTYSSLYTSILKGFDKKLFAISTVTAAFIDGDEHDQILAIKKINTINYDDQNKKIYGLNSKKEILTIDETNGTAFNGPPINLTDTDIKKIAFDSKNRLFYAIDNNKHALITIDPQTGQTAILNQFPVFCDSITYSNKQNKLIVTGSSSTEFDSTKFLFSIDPQTGNVKHFGLLHDYNLDALCFSDQQNKLYGIDNSRKKLVKIDFTEENLETVEFVLLQFKSTKKEIDQPIHDITINEQTGLIYGVTDRLVSIDIDNGIVDDEKYVKGFRNEMGTLFLKYVKPMRKIREKLGLTFVYTMKLTELPNLDYDYDFIKHLRGDFDKVTQIIYVVDSNVDESHTAIGYAEATPADKHLRDVLFKGSVHLSAIKDWDEWGLFKSGFSAIKNSKNENKAIAGADINVSIITDKTRIAMLKVAFVAIIAMLLVTYLSIKISKKVTAPIQQLKEVALGIAAGHYGKQISIEKPLELADLSSSFNLMSDSLEQTHENIEQTNFQHEKNRKQKEMIRTLKEKIEVEHEDISILAVEKPNEHCLGWTRWQNMILIWFIKNSNYDDNVRLSSMISTILNQYIHFYSGDWSKVTLEIKDLFCDSVQAFICIDLNNCSINSLLREQFQLCLFKENGTQLESLESEVILKKDSRFWIVNNLENDDLNFDSNIPLNIYELKNLLLSRDKTGSILIKI